MVKLKPIGYISALHCKLSVQGCMVKNNDDAGNQISAVAEFLTPSNETASEEYGLNSRAYDSIVEVTINEYNGLN